MRLCFLLVGTWWSVALLLLGLVCTHAITSASTWAVIGLILYSSADTQRHPASCQCFGGHAGAGEDPLCLIPCVASLGCGRCRPQHLAVNDLNSVLPSL